MMNIETPFEGFGSLVFSKALMKERLPYPVYKKWKETVRNEDSLDQTTADAIAHAMKRWALENGVTHFTHWFQPMTGSTAEKHDSFVEPDEDNEPLLRFSGKSLIKGEPDASSFPSGGLRATFEARGYTYWDCTSPAFIRDNILCIPTVFVSYNGESLDKKAPLLKSITAINNASTRLVNILGDKDVKAVFPVCGLEQEYFLIDKKYYDNRLDLLLTGRTLFGAKAPKGQELDDHYFGSIPTRVASFMKEVNQELWKLGIFAKAEHNEVAPCQFELAPVFSNCNIAIDQNQLTMDILRKTAEKHDFACLLHEKPFAGINGSGKHNNYSLVTNDGQNLYDPGEKPSENIRFLVFICAFIKAVDKYPELLRMSSSGAGNDHRLGANEAPPAVISIFLGSYIEHILMNLSKKSVEKEVESGDFSPISGLSYIPKDNTDRNRTSPVAFTGNKFEFRMLGSSLSAAIPNIVLNTINAEIINEIADQLENIKYRQDIRTKALEICKKIIKEHSKVLFSGDGYSNDWLVEASKRGLPNITSYIESIKYFADKKAIALFTKNNIYSEKEIFARKEILCEQYNKTLGVEVKTLIKMVKNEIAPLIVKDMQFYGTTIKSLPRENKTINDHYDSLDAIYSNLLSSTMELETKFTEILSIPDSYDCGVKIRYEIVPLMDKVRSFIDSYEVIATKEIYTIPTYSDMLF